MSDRRGVRRKAKNKSCIDCLHCKVSAKSTANNRLCYCAKEGSDIRPEEPFWLEKKVCGEFVSMGARITARPCRVPLLKDADFLGRQFCQRQNRKAKCAGILLAVLGGEGDI